MLAIDYYNENDFEKPCILQYNNWQEIITYINSSNPDIIRCWFSHAIPTIKAINKINNFINGDSCLEIGSGRALWSFLIGGDIYVTDKFPPNYTFKPVIKMDASDAVKYYKQCNVLLIIWPPCDSMASDALKLFNGNKVIYIGEDKLGCTGDSFFFELLDVHYSLIEIIEIPNIHNHRDKIWLYQKQFSTL